MLRIIGGGYARRIRSLHLSSSNYNNKARCCWYSTTLPTLSEAQEEAEGEDSPQKPDLDPKKLATLYAQRRNAYRKAVTSLRKEYTAEYEARRATDQAAEDLKREQLTRSRLERQRRKNVRSARNAALEELKRQQRAEEFKKELEVAQVNREARRERFQKARQLIVDELEAECHFWLTTPKEVSDAFDSQEAEQELWSRPGMYVGAPPAGLVDVEEDAEGDFLPDAGFWRYESHTWDMSKTYPSPRELMLEELNEQTYLETNLDLEYWTGERAVARMEMEDRAKLRAMVREEGRKILLKKQRDWMQGRYGHGANVGMNNGLRRGQMHHHDDGESAGIPKPMPAPKLDVLADYEAMEREGVKVLMKDPAKFFVFDEDDSSKVGGNDEEEDGEKAAETGGGRRTLGRPIRLRDPLRDNPLHPGTPYPVIIAKDPRPDQRSDREKKRAEREEKMRAAAASASGTDGGIDDEISMAADDMETTGEKLDYDKLTVENDIENLEWEEGLDPVEDEILLSTPREGRLSEDDVDWVIEQMEKKAEFIKEQMSLEEVASAGGSGKPKSKKESEAKLKKMIEKIERAAEVSVSPSTPLEERSKPVNPLDFFDDDEDIDITDREALRELGLDSLVDMEALETVLDTLTDEQREAIESLDSDGGAELSKDDIADALSKVPGLSEEQVGSLIELELSMAENKELREALLKDLEEEK